MTSTPDSQELTQEPAKGTSNADTLATLRSKLNQAGETLAGIEKQVDTGPIHVHSTLTIRALLAIGQQIAALGEAVAAAIEAPDAPHE